MPIVTAFGREKRMAAKFQASLTYTEFQASQLDIKALTNKKNIIYKEIFVDK